VRGLLLVALIGCGSTSFDPADWYGTQQVDLQCYRRIAVAPVSIPGRLEMEPNRAAYVGSLIQQALLREIEQGGRIAAVHAIGPYADRTLIFTAAITQARRIRERVLQTGEEDQTERWEHVDSMSIRLDWSVLDARSRTVVAKSHEAMAGISWGPTIQGRFLWTSVADDFAKNISQTLGIGPVPAKQTRWTVEVLAIERAHVDRLAARWRLTDEADPEALRRNLKKRGVPGDRGRRKAWESLSDHERALLAAEVGVRASLVSRAEANAVSLGTLARTLQADPALRESVHFLSAVVTGKPWVVETYPPSLTGKRIGPHRVDYSLVLPVERAIEQGGDLFVDGDLVLGTRPKLLAILVVRKLVD
jgi:hypothetical protein